MISGSKQKLGVATVYAEQSGPLTSESTAVPAGKRTKIYNLTTPDGEIRYVGKTASCVKKRLMRHIADARRGGKGHKCYWIRTLLSRGEEPGLYVIGEVPGNGDLAEQICIGAARALGARLTNATDGGEGTPGVRVSAETRAKLSEAHKGRGRSAETRAKIATANKGRKRSAATRAKMSESARKRWAKTRAANNARCRSCYRSVQTRGNYDSL